MMNSPLSVLVDGFHHACSVASATSALDGLDITPPKGRTFVLAIGKAAGAMAQVFEDRWPDQAKATLNGLALTRYGHGVPCRHIQVIEASHPVPDTVGRDAALDALATISQLGEDDQLICLISGGGSALLSLPAHGISFDDKQQMNRLLLASGLPIDKMNCVRKHLSAVKGGKLAQAAYPARCITVAISDVPGNDLSVIASGPTVLDHSTRHDAMAIVNGLADVPNAVTNWLGDPASETPKEANIFHNNLARVTVTPERTLAALAEHWRKQELGVRYLGADIEGEASDLGALHASQAIVMQSQIDKPTIMLSGGETTVTLANANASRGRGGRNSEYLLALLCWLQDTPGIYAIAADTDGIDGSEDNAGACIAPGDYAAAVAQGLRPERLLAEHNAYTLFSAMNRLLVTGPTRTNVNDYRAIYIEPKRL